MDEPWTFDDTDSVWKVKNDALYSLVLLFCICIASFKLERKLLSLDAFLIVANPYRRLSMGVALRILSSCLTLVP